MAKSPENEIVGNAAGEALGFAKRAIVARGQALARLKKTVTGAPILGARYGCGFPLPCGDVPVLEGRSAGAGGRLGTHRGSTADRIRPDTGR